MLPVDKRATAMKGINWQDVYPAFITPSGAVSSKRNCPAQEIFEYRVFQNNQNITLLSPYVNSHTKVKCKCIIDNYEWDESPSHLIHSKSGCPQCSGNLRLTIEDIQKRANPSITVISRVGNGKCHVKCQQCGYEWSPFVGHITRNHGCPYCIDNPTVKLTIDVIQSRISEISPNITIIGEYINVDSPIKAYCSEHDCFWDSSTPYRLMNGVGCPSCKNSHNVLYMWNVAGTDIYKIGVTRSSRGRSRLREASSRNCQEINEIFYIEHEKADILEKIIHNKYNINPYSDNVWLDGYTEFRRLTDADVSAIILFIEKYE